MKTSQRISTKMISFKYKTEFKRNVYDRKSIYCHLINEIIFRFECRTVTKIHFKSLKKIYTQIRLNAFKMNILLKKKSKEFIQ